jgi:hypothetical protein
MESTQLSRGHITPSQQLSITLEESEGSPAIVLIRWPAEATLTTPAKLQETTAKTMSILARASVRLSQIKTKTRYR